MKFQIDQKINHKVFGEGVITDIYEIEDSGEYIDVHFTSDETDSSSTSKYRVRMFTEDSLSQFII